MNTDLISVIMPVKNGENYLQEAIDGIKKQNMNVEIIVVDDCSTDKTSEIAENSGCKVVKHSEAKGAVAGKNSGIKVANGKYILFHDHDDIMREGALRKLYDEIISSDEHIYAVEGMLKDFYSPELTDEEKSKIQIKNEPYFGLFTGAILMKKSVFDKIGLFNENLYAGVIIEWQFKMNSLGLNIKKNDYICADRRFHSSNYGRTNKNTEFKNYAAILREKLKSKK